MHQFLKFTPVWHSTCRVSCRSKFEKLVQLVGFIIKKFVTMHGHMNVKIFECFTVLNRSNQWNHEHLELPLTTSSSTWFFPASYRKESVYCSSTEILLVVPEVECVRCLAVAGMMEQRCNFWGNQLWIGLSSHHPKYSTDTPWLRDSKIRHASKFTRIRSEYVCGQL